MLECNKCGCEIASGDGWWNGETCYCGVGVLSGGEDCKDGYVKCPCCDWIRAIDGENKPGSECPNCEDMMELMVPEKVADEWVPESGEEVFVRDSANQGWENRVFVADLGNKYKNRYVCESAGDGARVVGWEQIKQIPQKLLYAVGGVSCTPETWYKIKKILKEDE